jgi:hypothetical protein
MGEHEVCSLFYGAVCESVAPEVKRKSTELTFFPVQR